jgi:hypothetical protein
VTIEFCYQVKTLQRSVPGLDAQRTFKPSKCCPCAALVVLWFVHMALQRSAPPEALHCLHYESVRHKAYATLLTL